MNLPIETHLVVIVLQAICIIVFSILIRRRDASIDRLERKGVYDRETIDAKGREARVLTNIRFDERETVTSLRNTVKELRNAMAESMETIKLLSKTKNNPLQNKKKQGRVKLPETITKDSVIETGIRPVEIARLCSVSEPAVNRWQTIPTNKRARVMKEVRRRYNLSNKLLNSGSNK